MAGPGKMHGWNLQETALFGKLLGRAAGASGLWSGAAGRVRQRAAGAKKTGRRGWPERRAELGREKGRIWP